jgi:hypothetical protein
MTLFNESSLSELYASAVAAFPRTTMRQYATHPVVITHLQWTPYRGMKTLFVKGLAQSEGHEYGPIILFKGVNYKVDEVRIATNKGEEVSLRPLSLSENDVLVRCNCPDFYWRFNYYNYLDKSLYGTKRAKYEAKTDRGPANPMELPGMCKHIMKLVEVLEQSGIFRPS